MKKLFSRKRIIILIIIIMLAAASIFSVGFFKRSSAESDYLTAKVERGQIRNVVSATGTLSAIVTVQVGSQVSGRIAALYADFNSQVKAGQIIAKLETSNFDARVASARADLLNAEARVRANEAALNNAKASLNSAKANLQVAIVNRDDSLRVLKRFEQLSQEGLITARDLEQAQANKDSAEARVAQAQAQVDQATAQVKSAESGLEQAKAQLEQSKASLENALVDLGHCTIRAPIDGVVISRNVDIGQTVAASFQAPVLFTIANDLTKMQLMANIDEADIGKISDQVMVRFTVDAYPGDNFSGKISEIRLNPTTVQNVVTYTVVIQVNNPDLKLKPGMTANIQITVDERHDVLKIPNSALRFVPAGMTREKIFELTRGGDSPTPQQGPPQQQAQQQDQSQREGGARADRQAAGARKESAGNRELAGLSPEAQKIYKQLSDPNLSFEDRRSVFQKMRELPDEERQKLRELLPRREPGGGGFGGGFGGGGMGRQGDRQGRGNESFGGRGPGRGPGSDGASSPMASPTRASSEEEPKQAEKIKFPAIQRRTNRPGVIWIMNDKKELEPRRVVLGITDGTFTELISGDLKEGDTIIIGQTLAADQRTNNQQQGGQQQRPPFGNMGGFGGPRGGGGPRR